MIQLFVGLVFIFLILSFLFFVAWYIALPLLIVVLVAGLIGRVWYKIKTWFKKETPVERLMRTEPKKSTKKHHVIDVDYTEV